MTNPKWEIGPVKLVNGSEAFIDAINLTQEDFRYVGRSMIGSTWHPAGWHACGRMMYSTRDSGNNLAPPPKKTVRVDAMWVVVYRDKVVSVTAVEDLAKEEHHKKRAFAIRKIEPFEVTEGEGL